MPVIWTQNAEGERVQRYEWPANAFEWTPAMCEVIRELRKEASQILGLVAGVKDLKRDQLRTQRAAGFVLGALEGPAIPGFWPVELSTEFDWMASVMESTRG